MIRLVLLALVTLVLAALIHLVTILAIPHVASRDAYSRVMELAAPEGVTVLPPARPGEQVLPEMDPSMAHAVCPFDVSERPFLVSAALPRHYWAVAFHVPGGAVFYSVTGEAASGGAFEIELRNPAQMRRFRLEMPEPDPQVLHLEAAEDRGFALLRALVPNRTERAAIEAVLAATYCGPLEEPERGPGLDTGSPPVLEPGQVPLPPDRPVP